MNLVFYLNVLVCYVIFDITKCNQPRGTFTLSKYRKKSIQTQLFAKNIKQIKIFGRVSMAVEKKRRTKNKY